MLPAVLVGFLVITPGAWQRGMEAKDSGHEAGGTGGCMAQGQREGLGHEADMGNFGAFWRGS